jgi:tyrosine-specific transport protein
MSLKNKQFLYGISMIIGMIIGVGLFGVPYAVAKAGWLPGLFYFILISFVLILTHLFYGEVVLRTREAHRFVGFAEKYLGKKYGKLLGVLANVLGFYGALLAYIIIGGQFLHLLFSSTFGGSVFLYQVIFFIVMSLSVFIGARLILGMEMIMSGFLLLVMIIISGFALKFFDFSNLILFDKNYIFLPYGVILFALGGSAAIPEVRDILKEDGKQMKKIIFWGSLIPFLFTLVFTFAVVGATGLATSEETIQGLRGILGNWIVFVGAVFGFMAISTSYLILGLNLKEMYRLDLKMNKLIAWFLAVFIPFFIFLIGSRSFIKVIDITGSLFGGFSGILLTLMYLRAKKLNDRTPEYDLKIPKVFAYLVVVVYFVGIVYEVVHLF